MALYRIKGHSPVVPPNAYVAAEASLVGEVVLGERCSVWPGAALRGDNEPIRIGEATNIQEGAVLHADAGFPLTIGTRVSVGHQAMLHGCTVGDGSLIGIQAIVLNGAVIGRDCLVAAGALITERKTFPDRSLIVGTPAKLVRELTDEEVQRLGDNATGYAQKSQLFLTELERVG
jgi:carbonic anhydrase/acetyltransferase-like protein (isoleucine patch superfamily)